MKSESEVTESCPTLSDPMDCSTPGSSVHGIFQARVLEWGAIAFSWLELGINNGMDLKEAKDIKRWQGYTEEFYEKGLKDPDNHDGVITHLEPDILACEVKWALGSITTNKYSEGDGIPAELFQTLKDDCW